MSNEKVIHTTDATFQADVLDSKVPVIVDFWAPWCGPCKSIAPVLDQLADRYDGKLKIAKMNVDENKEVLSSLGIRGIPALYLYDGGEVASKHIGAAPEKVLVEWIEGYFRD